MQVRRKPGHGAGHDVPVGFRKRRLGKLRMAAADGLMKAELSAAAAFEALWNKDNALAALDLLIIPVGHLRLIQVKIKIQTAVVTADHHDGVGIKRKVFLFALTGRLQQRVPAASEIRIKLPVTDGIVLIKRFKFLKGFPVPVHLFSSPHKSVGNHGIAEASDRIIANQYLKCKLIKFFKKGE